VGDFEHASLAWNESSSFRTQEDGARALEGAREGDFAEWGLGMVAVALTREFGDTSREGRDGRALGCLIERFGGANLKEAIVLWALMGWAEHSHSVR
jgi:hypothetical protein